MNCGVTRGVTFDLCSMRAMLKPHEDVWYLYIVVYGVPRSCLILSLCVCCLHMLKATVDWSLLPASCLRLIVLSFQRWSVSSGKCERSDLLSELFFQNFTSDSSVLFSFPSISQAVAHDLINGRVKAVTRGHSWCVRVCMCVWNPIQKLYLLTGSSSASTERCDTRGFVANWLLLLLLFGTNALHRKW